MKSHGKSGTRTYHIWGLMQGRCNNPNNPRYKYYGGRGIQVCIRWRQSFKNFLEDMGTAPAGMSIERRDVDGDYSPDNCCWATQKQQTRNARSNVKLSWRGKIQCVTAWAEELGISAKTIRSRLRAGWPIGRVLGEKPVLGRNQAAIPAQPAIRRARRWKRRPVEAV